MPVLPKRKEKKYKKPNLQIFITMNKYYVESPWWLIKSLDDQKFLHF